MHAVLEVEDVHDLAGRPAQLCAAQTSADPARFRFFFLSIYSFAVKQKLPPSFCPVINTKNYLFAKPIFVQLAQQIPNHIPLVDLHFEFYF